MPKPPFVSKKSYNDSSEYFTSPQLFEGLVPVPEKNEKRQYDNDNIALALIALIQSNNDDQYK